MISKHNLGAPDPNFYMFLACLTVVARRKPKVYQVSESRTDRAASNAVPDEACSIESKPATCDFAGLGRIAFKTRCNK